MKHYAALLLLSAASITGAYAQSQTPASAAASIKAAAGIAEGNYAGTVQEQSGKRTSNLKLTIRDVTTDGRVTGTMEATHPRANCAAPLPVNGIVMPEGLMRLTADDGVPKGCERVYNVTVASGGTLSGTFFNGRVAPAKPTAR